MAGSFLAELRRRRVFRVGSIYVLGGWIVLQFGDAVLEPLGVPEWAHAALILAVFSGFPVAIVLAWVYELTGRGLVRDPGPESVAETGAEASVARTASAEPRIAVLPFTDTTPGAGESYLGDGIAEEMLNALTSYRRLRVIARTSSFRFRGDDIDLSEVREKLGATHILTGSVRRAEDRVRVSAQLVDTAEQTTLLAETKEDTLDELLRVHESLARSVATQLLGALRVRSQRRWSMSPDAYEQYLMAVHGYRRSNFPEAVAHCERSAEIDGNNPLVHSLMADIHLTWTRFAFDSGADALTEVRGHADRALAIDPDHLPAQAARAMLRLYLERDFAGAFERAIEISTQLPTLVEWLPVLLSYADRYEDAVAVQEAVVRLDPLSSMNAITLARRYNWLGRTDRVQEAYARAVELEPRHMLLEQDRFQIACRLGELDRAEDLLRRFGLHPDEQGETTGWIPRTYALWLGSRLKARQGDPEGALALAQEIEKRTDVTPTLVVETYLNAGDIDSAFRICNQGIRQFDPGMYDIARPHDVRDPSELSWLAFSSDARYPKLLERLGIDDASLAGVDWGLVRRVLNRR